MRLCRKVALKKKILIIVENLPVPRDVRVWREARSLRDAGYEVISPLAAKAIDEALGGR